MRYSLQHYINSIAVLTGVLSVLVFSSTEQPAIEHKSEPSPLLASVVRPQQRRPMPVLGQNLPNTPTYRIAQRLQRRLWKRGRMMGAPSIGKLAKAVEQRQALLKKHVRITFSTEEDENQAVWDVSVTRYPLWVEPRFSVMSASFSLSANRIAQTLEQEKVIEYTAPTDVILKEVQWREDDKSVSRAIIEGVAKPGYTLEPRTVVDAIFTAFETGEVESTVNLTRVNGVLRNDTGIDLGDLTLWATGKSNFKGSTWARSQNVKKALDEHVNNTIVAPGETFSFNGTLDGPVSLGMGWKMAKIIKNGSDLVDAPGGGICQASTTTYRAIVNAGFPVVERRSHSLYVYYYKKFGVGIDATIYPGSQDLTFLNDSGNHLLVQAYTDDDKNAFVNIYGTPDGRTVELEGPYFADTAPEGFQVNGRGMWKSEIAWIQKVSFADGSQKENTILSRYKFVPKTLVSEFPVAQKMHAAGTEI